jgi:hypothetical protein
MIRGTGITRGSSEQIDDGNEGDRDTEHGKCEGESNEERLHNVLPFRSGNLRPLEFGAHSACRVRELAHTLQCKMAGGICVAVRPRPPI